MTPRPVAAPEPRGALRRDAERNRDRIVRAAQELFAERGLTVGFNEVAHHAGVGVGTVYRRFADKEELIHAALAEPLGELAEVAQRAGDAERAWDGLELLLGSITELLVDNLGLRDVALGGGGWQLGRSAAERVAEVMTHLLDRARAEGDLRDGVVGDDVTMILWLVTDLAQHSVQVRPGLYRRYLQVMLDGLRAWPGRTPLVERPTEEQALTICRRWAGAPL
ncbi:MAG: TetR/AcrR family transcriptional regulator [Nonomuraea sp.]|nr:TetR/AcrR family transcriptional regulator [Nonomuraea sp.]NUP69282.1 TetR/AcrR family transcriptional regulator [Nonomuraea sp.]NUP75956.1 TetR/AcrR family transcriptional regulator [Nonomuraea sp.]NUS00966.1 TetR/AcrR family transcriptional regulator [Nonomuraea sp.]